MLKLLITDFEKVTLLGDVEYISESSYRRAYIGKLIRVKILGLFWIDYKWFYKKRR